MKKNNNHITSLEDLIASIEGIVRRDTTAHILFRGQSCDDPLLPKIARKDPEKNKIKLEKEMINEFRRRLARERDIAVMDDWDLLVYAQHYGLATRLLDWTTNPLFALWFACSDYKSTSDSYIYSLIANQNSLLNSAKETDPFKIKKTYVVRPNENNSRIKAQSGWFTVHKYSKKSKKYVDLSSNTSIDGTVLMKTIPSKHKLDIMKFLDKLGINEESVYLGAEGTAKYINWLHRDNI